ncbi:FG-GAP repeat domain-containing protein [Paenibacillus xanthanilyticus]|uniref:FG-GAP repeat domain-containing protein n=1 Tax=Paenibacillus xanthanilyticus TaxID=1783531 RepID=A0ABV8K888_9BACL
MRLRRPLLALLSASTLATTAGCQYTMTPADLLTVPQAENGNTELAQAIRVALPPRAKLTLADQSSLAAVRKADVDGDGSQEAIVTYVTDLDTEQVMVMRAESSDGRKGWRKWFTLAESTGYGVDWLEVDDLDDDGRPELVVGWNEYDEPQHRLFIYTIDAGADLQQSPPVPLAELTYEQAKLGDVDGNGKSELVVIQHEREQMTASLHLYRVSAGQVKDELAAPIDGTVDGYYNLAVGQIAAGRYGVIMDGGIGAHSSLTNVLAWANGRLMRVYPPVTGREEEQWNASSTFSGDGNGDGILDIETLVEAPGQPDDRSYADTLWIEERRQWDGSRKFDVVQQRYADYGQGYALRFPAGWYGQVTVSRSEHTLEGGVTIEGTAFEYYEPKTKRRAPMFWVYAVPLKQWETLEQQWKTEGGAIRVLTKSAGMAYVVLEREAPRAWDDDIRERFEAMRPSADALAKQFELIPDY